MPTGENHKIIRVVDHLCPESLPPFGDPPVLQKPVHVQVGQQRAHDGLNAKDNFQFDRAVGYRQEGQKT
jgi:hypothetical protein